MLPLLMLVGKVPLKLATGTTLAQVFIAATTGMLFHHRAGMVDLKAGLLMGIAGVVGGFIGSFLSVPLSPQFLQFLFLLIVGLTIILFFIPLNFKEEDYVKGEFNKMLGIAIGIGAGCLAGLLGVGGGFIIIPLMIYVLRIPFRVTIGTSLLIILISSLGTLGAKFSLGQINLLATLLVVSGSVVGVYFGAHVSRKIHVKFLRLILLSLLALIFISMGFKTVF